MFKQEKGKAKKILQGKDLTQNSIREKDKVYFLPKNWPIRASHLPHLCKVTPLYLELPLGNPVLCRRSTCTNSSLVRLLICCTYNLHLLKDRKKEKRKKNLTFSLCMSFKY